MSDGVNIMYDVFLSYCTKDKELVLDLANRLQQDGLKVWFDDWQLKPGDNLISRIDHGLLNSRLLVQCISANGLGSEWAKYELNTFRCRDPLNQNRNFIPLRLDESSIPATLAQYQFVDWLPDVRETEYERLLAACRQQSPKAIADPTQAYEPNQIGTSFVRSRNRWAVRDFSPEFETHDPQTTGLVDYFTWHERHADLRKGNGLLCSATYGEVQSLWSKGHLFVTYEAALLRFVRLEGGIARRIFFLGRELPLIAPRRNFHLLRTLHRHYQLGFAPRIRRVLDLQAELHKLGVNCEMFATTGGNIANFLQSPDAASPILLRTTDRRTVVAAENAFQRIWNDPETIEFDPKKHGYPRELSALVGADIENIHTVAGVNV